MPKPMTSAWVKSKASVAEYQQVEVDNDLEWHLMGLKLITLFSFCLMFHYKNMENHIQVNSFDSLSICYEIKWTGT